MVSEMTSQMFVQALSTCRSMQFLEFLAEHKEVEAMCPCMEDCCVNAAISLYQVLCA